MILLISLRVKIGVQMGIELNYYKRFVSVSDAIKKNSVHLPFYPFHSTKSAGHDNALLPRTGVHNKDKGG